MNKLLHVIAAPRGDNSRTLAVSNEFLNFFKEKNPDCVIDELNLFKEELPALTVKSIDGKYTLLSGKDLTEEQRQAWKDIIKHIERFLSADMYVISTPMWNFGIPYLLKQHIDIILQPRYLFHYTENGPEGLVKNKKMVVITSRGGDYSQESSSHAYDLQEPYIRTVFGFAGFTDISFINAQPMDAGGPEIREKKLKQAKQLAKEMANEL